MNENITDNDEEFWVFPLLNEIKVDLHEISPPEVDEEALIQKAQDEAKKEIMLNQINLIESIQKEIKEIFDQININFLQQLVDVIKKIIKKLIAVQLNIDQSIVTHLLNEAIKEIKDRNNCRVFLCSKDYESLQESGSEAFLQIMDVDDSLESGDFKIVTPTNEILSILEDKLEAILSLTNEIT